MLTSANIADAAHFTMRRLLVCVCVLLSLAAAAEDTLEGETVGQGGEGEGEEQGDNIDLSDILKMGECGTVGDSYPAADKMELLQM